MNNLQFVIEFLLKNKEQLVTIIDEIKEKHDIDIDTSKADKALDELRKTTNKAAGKNVSLAQTITAVSTAYLALQQVAQKVQKVLNELIDLKNIARDAEETENKFETVFESIQEKAEAMAESLASSYGMASSTAKELLGDTGDILVGFGFTEKAALELSYRVNSLSVDLASFTNYEGGAAGASKALTKAILGETEGAKGLGIVLRQGTSEFKEQVKALQETEGMTYNQAMATVLLNDAYRQSGKAVGDYARTQHQLANQERVLSEVTKTLKEQIGEKLIPIFSAATGKTIEFFRSLTETSLESTIREMEELGVAAEDILVLKKFSWNVQLQDINSELKKAGINYEDIKDVTKEISNLTEQEIQLLKYSGDMEMRKKLNADDVRKIYTDIGLTQEEINEKVKAWSDMQSGGMAGKARMMIQRDLKNQTDEIGNQKTDLAEYSDLLIEREALEKKINQTIEDRPDDPGKPFEADPEDVKKYYESIKFEDTTYKAWKILQIEDEISAMEISEDNKIALKKQKLDELDQAEEEYRDKKKEKAEKADKELNEKKLEDQKQFYVALKFEDVGYKEWKIQQIKDEVDEMEISEDQRIALKKLKLEELEEAEENYREDKKEKETDLVLFLQNLSRSYLDGMISEIDELFNHKQERSNEDIELEMELNEINHQERLAEIDAEMEANRVAGKDNKKLMLEKQKLENAYAKQKKKLNKEIADNEKSLGAKMVDVMQSGIKAAIMMLAKEAMGYAFTSVLKVVPFPLNLVAAPLAAATAYAGVSAFAAGLDEGGLLGDEHDKKILEQYIPPGEDMLIAVKKGEYVLNTEAVRKYFPIIDQMNELSYSDGGLVGDAINYGLSVSSGAGGAILQILMEIRDINKSGFEKKSDVTVNNEFNIELDGENIAKTVEEITTIEEGRSA